MNKTALYLLGGVGLLAFVFLTLWGARFVYHRYVLNSDSVVLKQAPSTEGINILFLHHSIGESIWNGGMARWFKDYNRNSRTDYQIVEQNFPKRDPYGWKNYPFDYWNIWVNNEGTEAFKSEPTLEMITQEYEVVVWKHCAPVSGILEETGEPDIASESKTIKNYKLQYDALKAKMLQFPDCDFIVWTGAAIVENGIPPDMAARSRSFFEWVRDEWDQPGDNIFLWDFFELETEGGSGLKLEYAVGELNSHPNNNFSRKTAPLICQRIVDVIEGRGDTL